MSVLLNVYIVRFTHIVHEQKKVGIIHGFIYSVIDLPLICIDAVMINSEIHGCESDRKRRKDKCPYYPWFTCLNCLCEMKDNRFTD